MKNVHSISYSLNITTDTSLGEKYVFTLEKKKVSHYVVM